MEWLWLISGFVTGALFGLLFVIWRVGQNLGVKFLERPDWKFLKEKLSERRK